MQSNKLISVLLVFALLGIAFAVGYCKRERKDLASVKPTPAEQARTATMTTNTAESAKWRKEADKWKAKYIADSTERAAAKGKDKAATEKARLSALKYAETNKPEDCNTALVDCQEENATKLYSLGVQERMLKDCEDTKKADDAEIARQGGTILKLDEGWKKTNVSNDSLKVALKKAQKPKKFGLGAQVGYTIMNGKPTPYIGGGLSYNFLRF